MWNEIRRRSIWLYYIRMICIPCSIPKSKSPRASPNSARRSPLDYEGKSIVLVGVLNGAVIFLADLMRQITIPVSMDLVAISSYGSYPAPAAWCAL